MEQKTAAKKKERRNLLHDVQGWKNGAKEKNGAKKMQKWR
jgi:hypothetical protein